MRQADIIILKRQAVGEEVDWRKISMVKAKEYSSMLCAFRDYAPAI